MSIRQAGALLTPFVSGVELSQVRAVRQVNLTKTGWAVERILERVGSDSAIRTVLCLGLAYKSDVDDIRESPAVEIVRGLAEAELDGLLVAEPNINTLPRELDGQGINA